MPRSTMPELSMEIEHPEEEDTAGYLKQSDYLKKPKPQKPSSLKKPVENTVESEEAVEKPVKKKRVMSEKQKAALAKAREVSAKKRKEKKALEGTTKPVKAKKPVERMPAIDEESESSSDDDDETPLIHEMPHVIQQRAPKKKASVEERVYQRIMSEKAERKALKSQKKEQDRLAHEYEQSIREDERRVLYELTQKAPKPKKQVNAAAMLQPNIWEQAFAPKRSPFGF
tara:strand:+ start:862 stop:1545 length:684 start_codon:yes stop_codon:yes gene_type:complete